MLAVYPADAKEFPHCGCGITCSGRHDPSSIVTVKAFLGLGYLRREPVTYLARWRVSTEGVLAGNLSASVQECDRGGRGGARAFTHRARLELAWRVRTGDSVACCGMRLGGDLT